MRTILSLFVVLFFVASCGGGTDGEQVMPDPVDKVPECGFAHEDVDFFDRSTWHLVEDFCGDGKVTVRRCLFSDETGHLSLGDWEFFSRQDSICYQLTGTTPYVRSPHETYDPDRDGEPDEKWNMCVRPRELEYFFAHVNLERRYEAPRVRVAEGTTQLQLNALYEAVGFINASLPEEYQIKIVREKIRALQGEPPAGEIYVDFARRSDWVDAEGYNNDLNIRGITRYYPESAHTWIHPSFIEAMGGALEGEGLGLLAHELLHSIGFKEHIPGGVPTIMWASAPPNSPLNWVWRGLLYPVDRAALEFLTDYDSIDPTEENLEIWFSEKGC